MYACFRSNGLNLRPLLWKFVLPTYFLEAFMQKKRKKRVAIKEISWLRNRAERREP